MRPILLVPVLLLLGVVLVLIALSESFASERGSEGPGAGAALRAENRLVLRVGRDYPSLKEVLGQVPAQKRRRVPRVSVIPGNDGPLDPRGPGNERQRPTPGRRSGARHRKEEQRSHRSGPRSGPRFAPRRARAGRAKKIEASPEVERIVLAQGESVYRALIRHEGSARRLAEVLRFNGLTEKSAKSLQPGHKLRLPPR